MRVVVDKDLCQGHAECVVESKEMFRLDRESNKVLLKLDVVPDSELAAVKDAITYCPTQALSLVED